MSNHEVLWIDINPSFDPIAYAQTFAEDSVVEAVLNADSPEEQLVCLYENGYLSKREGKMKYLLPNSLEETAVEDESNLEVEIDAPDVNTALAARALYKKMKARSVAKNENLDDDDIEFLVQEAGFLGFDIETIEDLDEAVSYGAEVDELLLSAAEEGLTENYSDEEILAAYLEEDDGEEIDESAKDRAMKAAKKAREYIAGKRGYAPGAKAGRSGLRKDIESVMAAPGKIRKGYEEYSKAKQLGRSASDTAQSLSAKHAKRGMSKMAAGGKTLGKAAGLAGAGLAARALYKRMKRRKSEKKNEALDSWDLQHILTDSQELGFEFEDYESLIETISLGELVDAGFGYYLGDNFLAEDLDEADELEVMDALLIDLSEEDAGRMTKMANWLRGKSGYSAYQKGKRFMSKAAGMKGDSKVAGRYATQGRKLMRAGKSKIGKTALAGTAALGAGALAAKKLRDRKKNKMESQGDKNESLEFRGYRSSAQGSVYESAPIPYGTGNRLYDRIRNELLS